jgi:hypothetical protein
MPWYVTQSKKCPSSKPWAVLKKADGSKVACHATKADADRQMAALYAKEGKNKK